MIEREELKKILLTAKDNDFNPPKGYDLYQLALSCMQYLGDTDYILRDELALSMLEVLIINKHLSDENVKSLLETTKNNLTIGLGNCDDSIFLRTFSMLMVAIIVYRHHSSPFLTSQEIKDLFDVLLYSYNNDKDVRGYIEEKGWAHGAAHGADAFRELAKINEVNEEMLKETLEAIKRKVCISYYGYIHNEDDRMARVIVEIINRNVFPLEYLIKWLEGFKLEGEFSVHKAVLKNNVRNFLRSLYFRLIDNKDLHDCLLKVLKEIN